MVFSHHGLNKPACRQTGLFSRIRFTQELKLWDFSNSKNEASPSTAVRRQPRVAKALAVAQGYARFAGAVARRAGGARLVVFALQPLE